MEIKVLQPVTSYVRIFKTVEDFNTFYIAHKAEMDALTTQMLNKMYLVDGFHITRIKGELMLKKYDETMKRYFSKKDEQDLYESLREETRSQIDELRKQISSIKDSVNKIILYLNPQAVGGDE